MNFDARWQNFRSETSLHRLHAPSLLLVMAALPAGESWGWTVSRRHHPNFQDSPQQK
jgi:hypothetical protein